MSASLPPADRRSSPGRLEYGTALPDGRPTADTAVPAWLAVAVPVAAFCLWKMSASPSQSALPIVDIDIPVRPASTLITTAPHPQSQRWGGSPAAEEPEWGRPSSPAAAVASEANPEPPSRWALPSLKGALVLLSTLGVLAARWTSRRPPASPLRPLDVADTTGAPFGWAMAAAVAEDPTQALSMRDVRGETLGAAVVLDNASISIGANQLLEDIELKILPRDRWGIVGPNGTGKSTLLKAITGQEPVKVSSGKVTIHRAFRVGYLEQKGVSGSTATVREEVTSRMDRFQAAKQRLEQIEAAIHEVEPDDMDKLTELLEELGDAQTEFSAVGGYDIDAKVAKVLKGLGFQEADFDRGCDTFSGGWQMRIALARLLLSEPEILILDEPTNHLDAAAKKWIANYVSQYEGTVLIVSHDENLLRIATSSIAEVRNKKLDIYRSRSYDQWLVEREEREQRLLSEYEKQQEQIAHLQGFVDRFGASANRASQAQSRVKMIEKLKSEAIQEPLGIKAYKPKLRLPKPPPCHADQLELVNAAFGWGDVPIVKNANVKIVKGDRIIVRGPNGAGKSTMLRALSGELPLKHGQRIEGEGLNVGFFKQDLAQELPAEEKAVDVVHRVGWAIDPELTTTEVRTVLGSLGLSQDKSVREIGYLSGGEKARVALACFALVPHNLLLLDEPSNHLDVETISSLVEAINAFKGAVIVVSHDRAFCESLGCTHVMTVDEGTCKMEQRELRDSDWDESDMSAQAQELHDPLPKAPAAVAPSKTAGAVRPSAPAATAPAATPVAVAPKPKAPLTPEERERQKQAQRKVQNLEKKFSNLDAKVMEVKAEMAKPELATNVGKLVELQKRIDGYEKEMDAIMEELESLESQ